VKFFFHAGDVGVVYVAAVEPFEEDWEVSLVKELDGVEERSMGNREEACGQGKEKENMRKETYT